MQQITYGGHSQETALKATLSFQLPFLWQRQLGWALFLAPCHLVDYFPVTM